MKLKKGNVIGLLLLSLFIIAGVIALSGNHNVKALQTRFDATLKKVYYEALNTISMDSSAVVKSEALSNGEVPVDAMVSNPNGTINGHELIAENANYEMYFLEESLSIIIRDKKTGSIMESIVSEDDGKSNAAWQSFMKSGIVVQALKGINIVPTTVDIRPAKKEVTLTGNGFSANVYYEDYGIGFQVNVTLTDEGFVAEIPNDSIVEDSTEYHIGEIYVYPFMGNTYMGERSGYMFIPDGNGALIYLEDNEGRFSSNFSQYVYGMNVGLDESYTLSLFWDYYQSINEADKLMAPVFGMVHTDSKMGYLGIIESGDYSAKIEAYPNGAYTSYNWITSKFVYRQIYTQPTGNRDGSVVTKQAVRNQFDVRVRYNFVSEDNADYTGLATNYRDYLIENGEINQVGDDFNIRLDFLGIDKENWLIFKRNVTMTTVENIREIFGELKEAGVNDILSVYKGWQKDGINALPITSYKADGDIGGTKELTDLMEDSKAEGIDFYLSQDSLRVNPSLSNANYNIMKKITKRVYEEETYKDVFETFRYLTPNRSKEVMEKAAKSYLKSDVNNIMLSGITNMLFAYYQKGVVYSRVDAANTYEAAVSGLDHNFNFIMEKPLAYLWKYADAMVDMPVVSSNYIFTDEEVPFFAIALKGVVPMYSEYTNFEANKQQFFLNLVEMGINPSFYITYEDPAELQYTNSSDIYSSKYSVYKDEIIEYYTALKEVHDKTNGSMIVDHNQYSNGVTLVTYDNGVKVYVNYNTTTTVKVDGFEIEPMSYKVGE
jgi:hypothetical protein